MMSDYFASSIGSAHLEFENYLSNESALDLVRE